MKRDHDLVRRRFIQSLGALAAFSLYPMEFLFGSQAQDLSENKRLSWLAHRGVEFEGSWKPRKIEGQIPNWIKGTLYRNGPGCKEVYGRKLTHFFDGDAYLSSFKFSQGQVALKSRFIETKERARENAARKMMYHDFGTSCEGHLPHSYKNPPNINVIPFSDHLLALSEAGHPTCIDRDSLESLGPWNFNGSLPENVSFTAHPKVDPKTGDLFAYGISRGLKPQLRIFRVDKASQKVFDVGSVLLGGYYPIHDMMLTENYLIFVVSPLKVNLMKAATMMGPVSEALEYEPTKPLRIFIVPKNGKSQTVEVESFPSGYIFHHVNAFEDAKTGHIIFDSFVMENESAYDVFKSWSLKALPPPPQTAITRFEIDLENTQVLSRVPFSEKVTTDFPAVDHRLLGQPLDFFYALESETALNDPLAFNTVTLWDFKNKAEIRVKSLEGQAFGEAIFQPFPEGDLVFHMGYDATQDESFLDIRNAKTLDTISRVWLGRYVPLGFHGCFEI